jgi:hypothetical protein
MTIRQATAMSRHILSIRASFIFFISTVVTTVLLKTKTNGVSAFVTVMQPSQMTKIEQQRSNMKVFNKNACNRLLALSSKKATSITKSTTKLYIGGVRSAERFSSNLLSIFQSGVVRQLFNEAIIIAGVATFICVYNALCVTGYDDFDGIHHDALVQGFYIFSLPGVFFSLTSPALSLLLGT